MKNAARNVKASTQKFIEIGDIDEDVVMLQNGNACLLIEVTASNFALLSSEEQQAKLYAYASLLNSLAFSIQIIIQNKRVDISSYLKLLDAEIKKTTNTLLAGQIELYRDFVSELVKVNTVLDKKFYLVIPYSYLEQGVAGASMAMKKGDFHHEAAKKILHTKAGTVLNQLARLGLPAKILGKEELIKLYFSIFNPMDGTIDGSQIVSNIQAPLTKAAP